MKYPNTHAVFAATCISVASVVSAAPTFINPYVGLALGGSGTATSPGTGYGPTSHLSTRAVSGQSSRGHILQRRALDGHDSAIAPTAVARSAHIVRTDSTQGSPSEDPYLPPETPPPSLRASFDGVNDNLSSYRPETSERSDRPTSPPTSPPSTDSSLAPPSRRPPFSKRPAFRRPQRPILLNTPLIGPEPLPNLHRDDASLFLYLNDWAGIQNAHWIQTSAGDNHDYLWVKAEVEDAVGYFLGLDTDQRRFGKTPGLAAGTAKYMQEHPRDFEKEPNKLDYLKRVLSGYMMQLKYGPGDIPPDVQKMLASTAHRQGKFTAADLPPRFPRI